MTLTDEATLIEQARADPAAFGILYDRYVDRIYAYALRQTADVAAAEDITATTFEKALRHIRRFRRPEAGMAPWLYRIAHNEIVQRARRERFTVAWGEEELPGSGPRHSGDGRPPEATLLAQERRHVLLAALRRLSDADRDVLTLRLLEGLPAEDVAVVLGCSRDNVYVRLHRALGRLRQQIEQLAETEAKPL